MSGTTVTGDTFATHDTTGKTHGGGVTYVFGITFAIILFLITLSYVSYKCKRSSSPPNGDDHRLMTSASTSGVDDAVLDTFPAFDYSEVMMVPNKGGSGCSICLADYKPADVIRLLPECGHLYHSMCIDTWLKAHPTCPVCRNSLSPVKLPIQRS